MAKNAGRGLVELSWNLAGQPSGLYTVQYRKRGSTSEWQTEQSYQPRYIITGLEDQTEYEYRIGSVCGNLQTFNNTNPVTDGDSAGNAYAYSGVQYFTTDSKDKTNQNYQCGVMPAVDIANKNLLQGMLARNEVFTAGDFPVTVISAQGSNGIYTGTGYIVVPYLADTKVKVSFNNIKLNTDKKLIEGTVETTYDPNESAVAYASSIVGETFGDQGVKEVIVDYNISDIKYTATPPPGKITIIGDAGGGSGNGGGSQQDLAGGKDYQIKDKDGNIWNVDENGNVTKGGKVAESGASNATNTDGITGSGSNATVNQYTAKGIKIVWEENTSGQFAYDTQEKTKLPANKYSSVKDVNGTTVYVPYKATVNKQTELFNAKVSITDPALKDAKIEFKTLSIGKAIPAKELNKTDTERTYQLELVGAFDYAEEEVIAVVVPKDAKDKQQVISSFRLVHLSPKDINVALVPTDAESKKELSNIETQTNAIYKKVGVNINFNRDDVFDIAPYLNGNTVIPTEKNTALSTYSSVQQAINKGYGNKNNDRYILFVTDRNSDKAGQLGYMRLNGQFGYVFKEGLNLNKTGAHELGHGIFKLEHPFENLGLGEKTTPLLMDYRTGDNDIVLSHLDWKQINDPAFKLYAFQSQSSGEDIATQFNYLMPNKTPFRFKNTDGKLATDVILVNTTNNGGNPNGTLYGFNVNGIEYAYKDGKFTSSSGVYENQYLDKNRNELFRLVIQDASDNCKYYLVNRNVADFNNLNLTPNNKPYNLCNKENLPLGGNGDANGNGTETREETLQKLNDIVINKLKEKFPEKEVKFTVLDKKDPQYQQKLDEALKQANYVIAVMDEEGKVQIKSSFKIPEWLANAMPDLGKAPEENCSNEYINEGLTSLQNSALYKNALRSQQIAMELGVIAYRGVFGTLYCMTDEKKFVGASSANQFVGGAMHEAIATFDVAQIVEGVISLVKSGAEQQIMSPVTYYNNLKEISTKGFDTNDDVKFAKQVMGVVLLPPSNTAVDNIEKGVQVAKQLYTYYADCGNLCWYRYGEASVIVIPAVISGGSWAAGRFALKYPALANKALRTIEVLQQNVNRLWKLERKTGKLSLLDETGKEIKNYEQFSEFIDDYDNLPVSNVASYIDNLFKGSRQRAIAQFGSEAEKLIYFKFNKDGGAAAEIIDHYGQMGIDALKKVNNIDDAAKELVKNKTVYRALNETTYNFDKLKTQGIIDASPEQYPIYVSLDNYSSADIIKSKLQLPKKPTWVAEFDGNQIIKDVRLPKAKHLTAEYREVLCKSYPDLGEGGGSQFITNSSIKIKRLVNLETGEIINFK